MMPGNWNLFKAKKKSDGQCRTEKDAVSDILRIDKSINTVGGFKHVSVFVRSQRQKYQ